MALSITSGNGNIDSQANTQSPQTSAGSGAPAAAPSSSVQPGTATTLLAGQGGVPLSTTSLPSVDLTPAPTTTTGQVQPARKAPVAQHHLNPVLLGLAIALFALAIIFFWVTSRSVKSTTY